MSQGNNPSRAARQCCCGLGLNNLSTQVRPSLSLHWSHSMYPNAADIKNTLTIPQFLRLHGYKLRASGVERRSRVCPWCGLGKSEKFSSRADVAICHSCQGSGDLFEVAAAVYNKSLKTDFVWLLNELASAAGLSANSNRPTTAPNQYAKRQAEEEEEQRETQLEAEQRAEERWHGLAMRSESGEAFLRKRGVLNAAGHVRFTKGTICIPIYRDGRLTNIYERSHTGPRYIVGQRGCKNHGTMGEPRRLTSHTKGITVVEGGMDYLSALLMTKEHLVLGAHGAHQLPYVAGVGARLLQDTPGELVFVPHLNDSNGTGLTMVQKAKEAAMAAGLSPKRIRIRGLPEGCDDLNDELMMWRKS